MQREDLEHIIRAAAALTKESDFIIIGSQAILGQYPDAPQALRVSMEADIYPRDRPELADQIDGSLGMDSPFDATFGYHADGVSPGTATCRARPSREGAGSNRDNRARPHPSGHSQNVPSSAYTSHEWPCSKPWHPPDVVC